MTPCAISLGGNVGDVRKTFGQALQLLAVSVNAAELQSSRVYRTVPMGTDAGTAFLNAACVFQTSLSAEYLLPILQFIEGHCGRVRTTHWGPRTLDLDLIFYGNEIINSPPGLIVPHPGCWYRRFVLDPLAELIPDFIHPVLRESVQEMQQRLQARPLRACVWGGWPEKHEELKQAVVGEFADVEWIEESPALGQKGVVRFAFPEAAPGTVPRTVILPDDLPSAVQRVRDVLTAALDEPQPI